MEPMLERAWSRGEIAPEADGALLFEVPIGTVCLWLFESGRVPRERVGGEDRRRCPRPPFALWPFGLIILGFVAGCTPFIMAAQRPTRADGQAAGAGTWRRSRSRRPRWDVSPASRSRLWPRPPSPLPCVRSTSERSRGNARPRKRIIKIFSFLCVYLFPLFDKSASFGVVAGGC